MKRFSILILIVCYYISLTSNAYAYLDPGTGSMLISSFFGIVATIFFLVKNMFYKTKVFFLGLLGVKIKQKERYGIVFFSEGAQYEATYRPILDELVKRNIKCLYFSGNENDNLLNYSSDLVDTQFIGMKSKAFVILSMLEADIFVSTTPGLDVLQLKRSKGVKHYCYIFHSCVDVAIYKLFSFDFYDSVFANGEHQIEHIRKLEGIRNTKAKDIYKIGIPYIDELKKKYADYQLQKKENENTGEKKTILVAPTWGNNGLLTKFGSQFLKTLLDKGHSVILRPHPQSYIVEKPMLDGITKELSSYTNLTWDSNPDNFHSLVSSDLLISDLSGIMFDFAFVFEKPVLTIKSELVTAGLEAHYIKDEVWEILVADQIGKQISVDDLENMENIIQEVTTNTQYVENIRNIREKALFNYGNVAKVAVDQLVEIHNKIK